MDLVSPTRLCAGDDLDAHDALDAAPHAVCVATHPRPDIEDYCVGGQIVV